MSDSDSTSPERRSKDEAAKGKSTVATPSKAKRQAGASQEAKLKETSGDAATEKAVDEGPALGNTPQSVTLDTADFSEVVLYAVAITGFALLVYWEDSALHGEFVYDDAGTVARNPLMNKTRPFEDILTHDYWGELLELPTSHKSFRPITTLTFRLNYEMVEFDTYAYHVTNVVTNAVVSTLSVFVANIVFEGARIPVILTGLLFAAHPIHTEAVSNITGRAEILMGLFYLVGYLVFVRNRRVWVNSSHNVVIQAFAIYTIPLLMAAVSMFCKENGLMLAVTCGLHDFLEMDSTVYVLIYDWLRGEKRAVRNFFVRSILAALCFGLIGYGRLHLNGGSAPDFIYDQNPAAFHNDTLTRTLSINMVYTLYLRSFFLPTDLCCDWSGLSIPLITEPLEDSRTIGVILLHLVFWRCVFHALFLKSSLERQSKLERMWVRVITLGLLGFTFCPFFFSSNILLAIGTMKAERLAYFPSLGMTMFVVAIIMTINEKLVKNTGWRQVHGLQRGVWLAVTVTLVLYVAKTKERNLAWSKALDLWESANEINPVSSHTQYNYGLELAKVKRMEEAAAVLAKAHKTDPNDATTIFVYAIVLRSAGNCSKANPMINKGLRYVERLENKEEVAERPHNTRRDKSNLLAIKALCSDDLGYMGKTLYEAIETDPSNEYAVNRGTELLAQVELMKAKGLSPHQIPLQQMLNF